MTYEANKYRIRPQVKNLGRLKTERMDRLRAIKTIAKFAKSGNSAVIKDFDGKTMSAAHKAKLNQIATLWYELDALEEAVRSRRRDSK